MIKALLLLGASALLVLGYDCPPNTFVGTNGQCYSPFKTQATWNNATVHCNSMGGQLALPRNAFDNSILASVLRTFDIYITWLGAYSDMGGVWYDYYGRRLNYTNWGSGQPQMANSYAIFENNGVWKTFQKGGYSDYVCQIPAGGVAPTMYPGNVTSYPTTYSTNSTIYPTMYSNYTVYPTMYPNGTNVTPMPNGTNPDPYNMTMVFQQLSVIFASLGKKN